MNKLFWFKFKFVEPSRQFNQMPINVCLDIMSKHFQYIIFFLFKRLYVPVNKLFLFKFKFVEPSRQFNQMPMWVRSDMFEMFAR